MIIAKPAWAGLACTMLALMLSCNSARTSSRRQLQPRHEATQRALSTEEIERLRSDLFAFGDRFSATVNAVASDIAWQSDSRRVRELALRWKIRAIPAMQYAVFTADPRFGLADAWVICIQMRRHFEDDENVDPEFIFEDMQSLALEAMHELEADIRRIVRSYATEEQFENLQRQLEEFAARNPVRRNFAAGLIASSDELARSRDAGLSSILAIPLAGLPESADAVERLARVGAVFTEVVEDLPQFTRWQAELLMMELDSLSSLEQAREDFTRLAASSESIAATFEKLPEEVRKELDFALESTDESMVLMRETLDQSQQTVDSLNNAMASAEQLVTATNEAAANLTETAVAWEATTGAIHAFIDTFRQPEDEPPAGAAEDEEPTPGVRDYTRMAEEYRAAAAELRALVTELESAQLTGAATTISETSRASVEHAAQRLEQLVNLATYRGMLLIAVLLAGMLVYGLTVARLKRRAA